MGNKQSNNKVTKSEFFLALAIALFFFALMVTMNSCANKVKEYNPNDWTKKSKSYREVTKEDVDLQKSLGIRQ